MVAILALVLASPLTGLDVKVDFNDKVDFASFRSFGWKQTQEPARSSLNHEAITRAVERELEAKGLAKVASGQADLLVRYFSKVEKRTRGSGRSEESTWQPSDRRTVVDFSRVDEIKLILELYTPAGLEPAWSATVTEALAPPDRQEKQLDETVAQMLKAYPPEAR
jgi:hypothetical protein